MLYSLNGTAFSFLSNTDKGSIPIVRTNPLALYGDNLVYWYDFTDTSTLFSNTGATVNVSGYGDTIRAVRSKSSYGQVIITTGATTTGHIYSAKTNLNGYGGLYRTALSGEQTNVFNETTVSIVTANTLYAVHMAYSLPLLITPTFPPPQWFFKIAGFGTGTNGRLYFAQNNAYLFQLANNGNSGDSLRGGITNGVPPISNPNNSLTVFSFIANFSAGTPNLPDLPLNSSKTILNNNYFGPRTHTAILNSTGTIRLQLGGFLPTGFHVQELILYQKDSDDLKFRAGHQYLRDKYLS